MMIHFIRPWWLLSLLPLLTIFWHLHRHRAASHVWQGYVAPHLAQALLSGAATPSRTSGHWLLPAAWCIGALALSGPAIEKRSLPVFDSGAARVLVMDMSASMYATDMPPNRLVQAKFRATDLINGFDEGDTALVAFAGEAFVISPLTRDKATLLNLLPSLTPDIMPVLGSSPAEGIHLAQELLRQGGYLDGDIILMTDGMDMVDLADVKRALKDSPYRLAVYGFGTAQGAPMKLPDGSFIRGNDDALILPKLDANILSQLAQSQRGLWLRATVDGSDITQLNEWMSHRGKARETELTGDTWYDLGPYIALLLLVPALFSFRHGMLGQLAISALLGFMLLPLTAPDVQAAVWQTKDQSAMDAFRQGNYSQAAAQFERHDWQAAAEYRAGNFDAALKGFEQDDSAQGLYNQANALMQLGRFDEAAERYQKALAKSPDFEEASANLRLAEALRQQQQEHQPSNTQGSEQSAKQQPQNNNANENADSDNQHSGNQHNDGQQSNSVPQSNSKAADERDQGNKRHSRQSAQAQDKPNPEERQPESDNQGRNSDTATPEAVDQQASGRTDKESSAPENLDAPMAVDTANDQKPLTNEMAKGKMESTNTQKNTNVEDMPELSDTAATNSTENSDSNGEQAEASTLTTDDQASELSPEMVRALKAVKDDPSVLLRNKMQLEYQLRRERGEHRKGKEKW